MDKIKEFCEKHFGKCESAKRLSVYLIVICVLLVVVIAQLCVLSVYLKKIVTNTGNGDDKSGSSSISAVLESERTLEDVLPIFEETAADESDSQDNGIKNNTVVSTESGTAKAENETEKSTQSSGKNPQKVPESTGKSETVTQNPSAKTTYVINKSSKKIHHYDCSFVDRMSEENRLTVKLTDDELNEYLNNGYEMCKSCGG